MDMIEMRLGLKVRVRVRFRVRVGELTPRIRICHFKFDRSLKSGLMIRTQNMAAGLG